MAHVLNHSRAVGTAKVVLLGIANHDGDGGAWPSIDTLARYANVDPRSVKRAIRTLEELGEVVVHLNDGGTRSTRNDQRPNRYELTVPRRGDASVTAPRGDAGVRDGVTPASSRGDAGVRDGVTPASPEPSMNHPEPSGEPSERASARTTTKATRIPVPFTVTDDMVAWAARETPGLDLRRHTDAFVDYWTAAPGAKGRKLDWTATWRNWMRTEHGRSQARARYARPTTSERMAAAASVGLDQPPADPWAAAPLAIEGGQR
jgi:hypothetical protein